MPSLIQNQSGIIVVAIEIRPTDVGEMVETD